MNSKKVSKIIRLLCLVMVISLSACASRSNIGIYDIQHNSFKSLMTFPPRPTFLTGNFEVLTDSFVVLHNTGSHLCYSLYSISKNELLGYYEVPIPEEMKRKDLREISVLHDSQIILAENFLLTQNGKLEKLNIEGSTPSDKHVFFDGDLIYMNCRSGFCRYNRVTQKLDIITKTHCYAFHPKCKLAVIKLDTNNEPHIYNLNTQKIEDILPWGINYFISPTGDKVYVGNRSELLIYDVKKKNTQKYILPKIEDFNADDVVVAYCSTDDFILLRATQTLDKQRAHRHYLWNIGTGALTLTPMDDWMVRIDRTDDGKYLIFKY